MIKFCVNAVNKHKITWYEIVIFGCHASIQLLQKSIAEIYKQQQQ